MAHQKYTDGRATPAMSDKGGAIATEYKLGNSLGDATKTDLKRGFCPEGLMSYEDTASHPPEVTRRK